jgi:2-polyprenyl-3-methyl-5-hydroxy-6-metoxy-1,4-benzoquinol methylase
MCSIDTISKQSKVKQLFQSIGELNPLQKKYIENSFVALNESERSELERYIGYCLNNNIDIAKLSRAYNLIVKDTLKEQMYFQRHQRYRHSSYKDVASAVYQNKEYMELYMYGLALSSYLWPNHVELHRYYRTFLKNYAGGEYLEVGPGHGYYMVQAMATDLFSTHTGVDISPTSIEITKSIISSGEFGSFSNYSLELCDFLCWNKTSTYDVIIMAEVLEHVEQPNQFLFKAKEMLSDDGILYITTCINAPAIDHIYLYESAEDLRAQVNDAGLIIKDELIVPYPGLSLAESMQKKVPINIAQVLRKA